MIVAVLADEEAWVVGHFRMLRQKRREGWIRFEVAVIRQQGGIEVQHLAKRRRVLLQQLLKAALRFPRVGVLGNPDVRLAQRATTASSRRLGRGGQRQQY